MRRALLRYLFLCFGFLVYFSCFWKIFHLFSLIQEAINKKVQSTNSENNKTNTQVEGTSTQAQTRNTEVQGTNTQLVGGHNNNTREVITIHGSDSDSESDLDKGKARQDDSTDTEDEVLDETHDQLEENLNDLQAITQDIFEVQKKLGSGMSETEKSDLVSEKLKSNLYKEDTYDYSSNAMKLENERDDDVIDPKVDKDILNVDNTLGKQSACVEKADSILKNSEAKPLENNSSGNLEKYKDVLQERDQLLEQRKVLTRKRELELETFIEQDNMERDTKKQKIDESQGQAENQKNTGSIIDDYADLSQELADYTGGDD
jgi:hypothetical protein